MLRPFGTATAFLVLVLSARAGDQAESKVKEFKTDLEQLNGNWMSPFIDFGNGDTGHNGLKLEFKKDSTLGAATLRYFRAKAGVVETLGPCVAELKVKDKKRFIVLSKTHKGKRVEVGEIAYEVNGNKLKLTCPKGLQVDQGGNHRVEISGEWQRKKADKK